MQLHVKTSTRYSELKFQLGLAKPRWNFKPGWKFQIFHIIDIFSNPGRKANTTRTCKFLAYFLKYKDGQFTSRFRITFHKFTNLVQCLQEFKQFIEFHGIYNTHRSYVKFLFLNIGSFKWLHAFEVIIVI